MLEIRERPRELKWYHAAGLLFGDWGTSRLYVLGLAFVMAGPASFYHVAAMCALVAIVGLAYTVICKHFPDGGGVYSAAKHRSRSLAVVGALLLCADYIITAALSAYEGFRYMLPHGATPNHALYAAVGAILMLGVLNFYGPRRAGVVALWVAVSAGVFYLALGVICVFKMGRPEIAMPPVAPGESAFGYGWTQWGHFVSVILALSGVEAIANMTGVMAEPVAKNARRAILVVLLEVVILNLVLAWAMSASPTLNAFHANVEAVNAGQATPEVAEAVQDVQDHMVRVLAEEYVGPWFATVSSFFFGLLLVFAANTAITDLVSIQYLMGRDKELPATFTRLNRYGTPIAGLVLAATLPAVVLLCVGSDSKTLAHLYAIGVVGAIAINLLTCGSNHALGLKRYERIGLLTVGVVMAGIEVTIAIDKPLALAFAGTILGVGLLARSVAGTAKAKLEAVTKIIIRRESPALPKLTGAQARLLVPATGNPRLLSFVAEYAKQRKAVVFVLFVREITLTFRERNAPVASEGMTEENDAQAQTVFAEARKHCEKAGVAMIPLYSVHDSAAEMIVDEAATLGVDAVVMGISRRGQFWKTFRGNVLDEVVRYMPERIPVLIHA